MAAVDKELRLLSKSLLFRVREDLLCVDDDDHDEHDAHNDEEKSMDDTNRRMEGQGARYLRQWLAYPRTLRLTTRPRPPLNSDGTRSRISNRISRSCDMPFQVLDLSKSVDELSGRLVQETLTPLFHKLHPEKSDWNLSLMNICATNMSPTAASSKDGAGRDISKMFRRQEHVLKEWKVDDDHVDRPVIIGQADSGKPDQEAMDTEPDQVTVHRVNLEEVSDAQEAIEERRDDEDAWENDDEVPGFDHICTICGSPVPRFAMAAHDRFHELPD